MDLGLVTILVVGLTALMGSFSAGIGEGIFGGSNRSEHLDQSNKSSKGWNQVGGKKK